MTSKPNVFRPYFSDSGITEEENKNLIKEMKCILLRFFSFPNDICIGKIRSKKTSASRLLFTVIFTWTNIYNNLSD